MNRFIFTIILIIRLSFMASAQTLPKENIRLATGKDIPYQVAMGYFVKNTFKKEYLPKAKITTQKEFEVIFGTAAVMGEHGMPTPIDFKKQYVVAIIGKVTNFNTMINPISLKKINNKILFEYDVVAGDKQTYTIQPLVIIIVDKKFAEKIETFNSQSTIDNPNKNSTSMLNNQWIIEYFNNPKQNVQSKNCYINIDTKLGTFKGNDGCNVINGKVKINGKMISFQNIGSTKMACENMKQGDIFVKNLLAVNSYDIKGGELFLYRKNLLIMTLESFK